jgi:hypothetical protein
MFFPHEETSGLDIDMTESLPLLVDSSTEIAWDYLNRAGELDDPMIAGRFLRDTIDLMVHRGERRRLMLANRAITAYQQFKRRHEAERRCSFRLDIHDARRG